jgi:hypothetical protein
MSLDQLRAAFLAEAEADAARRRVEVEAECERRRADAEAEASSIVEQGRLEGRLAGERESARLRGAARRRARELELGARGALFEQLRRDSRVGALELRSEAGYAALLDRYIKLARAQLGADAELDVDPPQAGGVRGRSGSRSVDYTLPALADRALAELDGEVERLWL